MTRTRMRKVGGYDHTDKFVGVKCGHADDSNEHAGNVHNDENGHYNHSFK